MAPEVWAQRCSVSSSRHILHEAKDIAKPAEEQRKLERQMALGAVGLKLCPVHGGFAPNDPALFPVYWPCRERGLPALFHCDTSTFPGSTNRYAARL